jgi:hypothetical protein
MQFILVVEGCFLADIKINMVCKAVIGRIMQVMTGEGSVFVGNIGSKNDLVGSNTLTPFCPVRTIQLKWEIKSIQFSIHLHRECTHGSIR